MRACAWPSCGTTRPRSWPVLLAVGPRRGPGPTDRRARAVVAGLDARAVGGRDLRSGGTWLASTPAPRRRRGVHPWCADVGGATGLRSRGELPLRALADPTLGDVDPGGYEPFALLLADARADEVTWWTWDRCRADAGTPCCPGCTWATSPGWTPPTRAPRQARWVAPFAAAVPDPFDSGRRRRASAGGGWVRAVRRRARVGRADALLGRHDVAGGSYGTRSAALRGAARRRAAAPGVRLEPDALGLASWAPVDLGAGRAGRRLSRADVTGSPCRSAGSRCVALSCQIQPSAVNARHASAALG